MKNTSLLMFFLISVACVGRADSTLIEKISLKQSDLDVSWEGLSEANNQKTGLDGYMLKGVVLLSGKYYFSIHNENLEKSLWLSLSEDFDGLHLVSYDEKNEKLLVQYSGIPAYLNLHESNIWKNDKVVDPSLPNTDLLAANLIVSRRPVAFSSDAIANVGKNSPTLNIRRSTHILPTLSKDNNDSLNQKDIDPLPQLVDQTEIIDSNTTIYNYKQRFGIDKDRILFSTD